MSYYNEQKEILDLNNEGFSSRAIAKKLGISKSKVHNVIRDNRMSTPLEGQPSTLPTTSQNNVSILPTLSNGQEQNPSILSTNQQNNMSTMSINSQNRVSILSKVPKNIAFLVEHLVSPPHIPLSEEERYDETMSFISIVNYHLESKRIYKEFIDTLDYLFYNSLLSLEEVDTHILKLKSIVRDTDKLLTMAIQGDTKDERFRLSVVYSNSLIRYLYSMKVNCKMEGEQFCEIQEGMRAMIEQWLSLSILKVFPFTYDTDCEQVENNFQIPQ